MRTALFRSSCLLLILSAGFLGGGAGPEPERLGGLAPVESVCVDALPGDWTPPVPAGEDQEGKRQGKRKRQRAGKKPATTEQDPVSESRDRNAASCNVDLACPEGEPWRTSARSIVRIVAFNEKCTGVLLNNATGDGTPYILTAAHCGDLRNATFYFNYLASECGDAEPRTREDRLSGSTPIVVEELLDLQLVRLLETPPASFHVLYAGWDRSGKIPESVTTLHHPQGDVMKISIERDPPRKVKSLFKIPRWDVGITERGSSGSPLFDPAHRVIGHLQGGSATCENPTGDQYRRLEKDWVLLEPFLDPMGGGSVALDALDPDAHPELRELTLASMTPTKNLQGGKTVRVVGLSFSPQTKLAIDGAALDRKAVRYLRNSLLEADLPEGLVPGEHILEASRPDGKEAVSLGFRTESHTVPPFSGSSVPHMIPPETSQVR